ncbi:MAG TPA: universal stress protein [Pseudolysinimonas sp.]|nr:universal stress protein [Pseudolysinimonas sp.]
MTSRYLVAVDGSRPAAAALRWAVGRAASDGNPLVLAHVLDDEAGAIGTDDEAARKGAQLLAETAARLSAEHPGIAISTRLLSGSVPRALASFADPEDMLVIGTGKTGFLHGRVLGARSVQIAMAASCSVAVIPDVDLRFRRGVVAGVDRHSTAAAIGHSAAVEAASRGEELLLLQAAPDRSTRLTPTARADLAIGEAIAEAREVFPELVIRSRVAARPPAEALLDSARDKALLVLGPGSLEPVRSSIGSVVHDVLLNANAPVLISRAAG